MGATTLTKPKAPGEEVRRELGTQFRALDVLPDTIDQEARTVEVAFSSEDPGRRWYGLEVLDHSPDSVRMDRLGNSAPVLWDHNRTDQRGVVMSASIDSDRVGRAVLRLGRNPAAEELWQDILDGIVSKISVGYAVHRMVLEEEIDEGLDVYRVLDWEPLEVSFVSIPMDDTVGIGRSSADDEVETVITRSAPAHPSQDMTTATEPAPAPAPAAPDFSKEREAAAKDARSAELARINEIEALGSQHNQTELARQFINEGKSADQFRSQLLEVLGTKAPIGEVEIGLSKKEVEDYSILRILRSLASPNDARLRDEAGFEYAASEAMEQKLGRSARGFFMPLDVVMQRDLTVGVATAGGNTVGTDIQGGSFIEVLRNAGRILGRSRLLTGLEGNVAIPRHSAATTAYWVAENGAPTEGAPTFDQVAMSPNTVGAFLDIGRRLLLQSSIDMDNFAMTDLATVLALAIDLAAINGSGASNQPTGVLNTTGIGDIAGGTNGAAPTWADIVNIKREVSKDNALMGDPIWALNSDTIAKLETTEKSSSTGKFIVDTDRGNRMAGFDFVETNQVPNDLDKGTSTGVCSAILFGNFQDLLIGMWGGLDLTVDPHSLSTTGALRIVALQDVDVAVRHPQSFSAMQDALTA
jgi:HK97 family phage major capsid protein